MQYIDDMEQQLWNYLDNKLEASVRTRIEHLITSDTGWKKAYGKVLTIHTALQSMETDMPSMRFTKKIMESVATKTIAPKALSYINHRAVAAIAGIFAFSIVSLLIYALSFINWASASAGNTFTYSFHWLSEPVVQYAALLTIVVSLMLFIDILLRRKQARHNLDL